MEKHFVATRLIVPILIIYLATSGRTTFSNALDAQKAHFILVHGVSQGAWVWYEVATLLQKSGLQTTTVDLASSGRDQTIADDVTSLEQYARPLTNIIANITTGKVILVGHSFGGVSISYEMELFPTKIDKGIFLSAAMPKNGQSLATTTPASLMAARIAANGYVNVYANSTNPSQITSYAIGSNDTELIKDFFNDSPQKDVTLALSLLKAQPSAPGIENLTLTDANYGSIPRYYIRTERDQALPPAVQSSILENNPPKEVFTLSGDHASYFSDTLNLTRLLTYISTL